MRDSILILLTPYDATESEFNDFAAFVTARIGARLRCPVTVDKFPFDVGGQTEHRIVGADDEQPVRAALAALWTEWSLAGALAWAADAAVGEYLPASREFDDAELDAIRTALGNRGLSLRADDRGLRADCADVDFEEA